MMATIEERKNSSGSIVYRVSIRKKGEDHIFKTFKLEEDAKIYAFYKEDLIDKMRSFDIPIQERVTFDDLLEFKLKSINQNDRRAINDISNAIGRIKEYFKGNKFYTDTTLNEWEKAALAIYEIPVFRGSKAEYNKRKMSAETLRKIFSYVSSCVSHAASLGIPLENHPLKVIQSVIWPLIAKEKAR